MLLPPLRPQLIALDMDGTICDHTNAIPPANIAALRACRGAGIHIVVLTGRRRSTLAPQLELLYRECEADQACGEWFAGTNSGGLLWRYPGWEQLAASCMPSELSRRVLGVLEPHSLNCYVNPAASDGCELVHLRRTPSAEVERYFARFGQGARHVDSAEELLQYEITQFALPATDELVFELADKLSAAFAPEELSVLTMRWPLLGLRALEAYGPDCNKANALKALALRRGVPRERTAAAGDDQNDMPMLAWAGSSAVMPHTPDRVAAAAQQRLAGSGVEALAGWLEALAALPQSAR